MNDIIIRAHQVGDLMTSPRNKSEVLSETAKAVLRMNAKQEVFGFKNQITSKYLEKGITHEHDSIELLNKVRIDNYTKHTGRESRMFLSGECDILTDDTVIDIKTSWSWATWPATPSEGYNKSYEWQLQAYMFLYDRPKAELIYCMVETDRELCKYEPAELHQVGHIEPYRRIIVLKYERDWDAQEQLILRLEAAWNYYNEYKSDILMSKLDQ